MLVLVEKKTFLYQKTTYAQVINNVIAVPFIGCRDLINYIQDRNGELTFQGQVNDILSHSVHSNGDMVWFSFKKVMKCNLWCVHVRLKTKDPVSEIRI